MLLVSLRSANMLKDGKSWIEYRHYTQEILNLLILCYDTTGSNVLYLMAEYIVLVSMIKVYLAISFQLKGAI